MRHSECSASEPLGHNNGFAPAIEVTFSLPGERVVSVLNRLKEQRGLPRVITVDNGPEFRSQALQKLVQVRSRALNESLTPDSPRRARSAKIIFQQPFMVSSPRLRSHSEVT